MEVDRILYIFGSFTRKKQDKRKSLEQSSISAGNSPLRGQRVQRPVSQNLNVAPRTSAYEGEDLKGWECGLCRKELVEPRLLACLHSFCTSCLQGLHQEGEAEEWSEVDRRSVQHGQLDGSELRSQSCAGSAGSGYESDLRHSGSDVSWDRGQRKYGIFTRRVSGKSVQFLLCPTCSHETPLPIGGIAALPLNYILLRKMVAAGRDESANVLCDLCNSDNKAESKCDQCLVSVCSSCSEAHGRQKATSRHSLRPLDLLPVRHCTQHPRAELSVYCATCQQVICRDCCIVSHSGHALSNASRAAGERARTLSDASQRARHVPAHVQRAIRDIEAQAFEADSQAARLEGEVQAWAGQYRRAVEAHARALCAAAADARQRYRLRVHEILRVFCDFLYLQNNAKQSDSSNMEELINIESYDTFKSVLEEIFELLHKSDPNPIAELDRKLIIAAKDEIRKLIITCDYDLNQVAEKIKNKNWNHERLELLISFLQENKTHILNSMLLFHNSVYHDSVTDFNWLLKIVFGTSDLKVLKYPLIQLQLLTVNCSGSETSTSYDINMELLSKLIMLLESNIESIN